MRRIEGESHTPPEVLVREKSRRQAELKRELKTLLETDPSAERVSEIRRQMYLNRRGREGLRVLNKILRGRRQSYETGYRPW